jgi:hypothetical protein
VDLSTCFENKITSWLEITSKYCSVTYTLQLRYLGVTMAYKIGDTVRVKGVVKEDPFKKLKVGIIAPIVHIWQNAEYPYQIEGYSECLNENELEAAK